MVSNNHFILFFEFFGLSFKVWSSIGLRKFGCGNPVYHGFKSTVKTVEDRSRMRGPDFGIIMG